MTSSAAAGLPAFPVPRSDPFEAPPEYARLREERPVTRVQLEDGKEAWLVTTYAQAKEVLGNRRFSSDATRPGFPQPNRFRNRRPFARTVIRMDPPEHARYRRMLNPEFVIRRVEAMRPEIQLITDGLLDGMVAGGPPADLVANFALPLPSLVICELLGVPHADRAYFEGLSRDLVTTPFDPRRPDRGLEIFDRLEEYMKGLVETKRATPGDDMLSRLIEVEADGGLTPEELVDTGRLLLLAGHVTTANMISLGVLILLRNPQQLADLREDPGLMANTVEEVLRHQTLIRGGLRRVATEDVEVGGQLIRAGEGVIVLIEAANRDLALGGDDRFDIHRGVRHHLSFGFGFHQCLGQLLARVELQVALGTIVRRFPTLDVAVPMDEVRFREDGFLHGVHELPVTW
jgi:cytochrome P450